MESVTAARAMLLTTEESLEGATLISVESQSDLEDSDALTFIEENFSEFLRLIRLLSKTDQELLCAYYMLSVPQTRLGGLVGRTQTVTSFMLRRAVRTLCCYIIFGGVPSQEQLAAVIPAAHENVLKVPLSVVISDFVRCRSYAQVASRHGLWRPDVRREMSRASNTMAEGDSRQCAVAAWISNLLDSAAGRTAKRNAVTVLVRHDPSYLGSFRIKIEELDDALFAPRAVR